MPMPLTDLTLVDACELPSSGDARLAIGVAADGAERLAVVPLAQEGPRWRRAIPGDGVSAAVAEAIVRGGAPLGRFTFRPFGAASPSVEARAPLAERPIGVDQTNLSIVVADEVIVKWMLRPEAGSQRAATLLAHLKAVGYSGVPHPYGSVSWRAPDGTEATIALADRYLPDARDGWDWCVARLEAHLAHGDGECPPDCDPWIGGPLGSLVAGLHGALATPSDVIEEPIADAGPGDLRDWVATAIATVDEALTLQVAERSAELAALASPIRNVLATLATDAGTPIQPVHGDLHVGQVLEWRNGLAIIDFDGNPTLGDGSNALRQPAARDVAQMTTSLDHVGRVVAERVDASLIPRVSSWIADTTTAFLAAYREGLAAIGRQELFDEALLAPFEVEQECRELVYAARFLPSWRYAPMAALRARFRGR